MGILTRRFALWGGAAAIAAGGFAFMASNTVGNSSAGEGAGLVYGYNVTNQHYVSGNNGTAFITRVTFTLTSQAKTSNADIAVTPATVNVYPEKSTGTRPWGKSLQCTINGNWTILGTGAGTGNYTCVFSPKVIPVATFGKLDVEASA